MNVNINVDNFKILKSFYDELSGVEQTKIWMSAYRKASVPLLNAAKANVPKKGMGLYRSLGVIEIPEKNAIDIGSKTNTQHLTTWRGRTSVGKVWYAHLLEWGTKTRAWKARKNHKSKDTGSVKATHFFENAWNSTHQQVENNVSQEWGNAIDKYIDKINKKK